MLAIIGGSGLTQLSNLTTSHREVVRTPYGEPSSVLTISMEMMEQMLRESMSRVRRIVEKLAEAA